MVAKLKWDLFIGEVWLFVYNFNAIFMIGLRGMNCSTTPVLVLQVASRAIACRRLLGQDAFDVALNKPGLTL